MTGVAVLLVLGMAFNGGWRQQEVQTAPRASAPVLSSSARVSLAIDTTARPPVSTTRRAVRLAPPKVPYRGPGTFTQAKLSQKSTAKRGRLVRYDVRVERGLPFDAAQTARIIQGILDDQRSWRGSGDWRFELVSSPKRADIHAYLATPATTDKLCAPLLTRGSYSCQNQKSVVFNAKRWASGAKSYGTNVTGYRRYLVNHEFGHTLGRNHVGCPGKGRRAPVMMQQTKGLRGCRANSWPFPQR